MLTAISLWLRTVRHFPLSALVYRLRLKISKALYQPLSPPMELYGQGQDFLNQHVSQDTWFLPDFGYWQYQSNPQAQSAFNQEADRLVKQQQGELLNEPFHLLDQSDELSSLLIAHSPLWRENYGYLEFLLPLIWRLRSPSSIFPQREQAIRLLESQFDLFWTLAFKQRCWSTYGVSRRLLTYCELLPILTQLSEAMQQSFWAHLYQETCYLVAHLEWDVQGNHLIQNLTAWLAVTRILRELPATQKMALAWEAKLQDLLPATFSRQMLPDGFHYECTPMYHLWVLRDLLDCVVRLRAMSAPSECIDALVQLAEKMLETASGMMHVSGQIPLFGDASLPQTPDSQALLRYASEVAGVTVPNSKINFVEQFQQAGLARFMLQKPRISLIVKCGDFGNSHIPAHAHCDLGSFELHGAQGPLLVDSGVSEYIPSLLRDYFRGTAVHNTIWFPGEEQAEIWSSFRVAEYPRFHGCAIQEGRHVENSDQFIVGEQPEAVHSIQLTLAYENHNGAYRHQRSITQLAQRFWIVEDAVKPNAQTERDCWSLLHVHPDCSVQREQGAFIVDGQLLIIPFGAKQVEHSNLAPWRENLNLYSAGFNQARPGQIIALRPEPPLVCGWILVPYETQNQPVWYWRDDVLTLQFAAEGLQFSFKAQSEGLRPCVRLPAS